MAPRLTLSTFPPSQNAARPERALLEKGLAFEKVPLDLLAGEHKQPPLAVVNPRGQVPTLVCELDGGREGQPVVVYESLAIVRFIDDLFPSPAADATHK